jgi:uncharacterized protein (TIGR02453 family)
MADTYFSKSSLRFLGDLAANNSREWFHANKARYEAEVRDPFLRLIGDLAPPLEKITPHLRADVRTQGGSLFRIQRDTRFANDKTPYKTWAGARLYHERSREIEAPSFYVHIQPKNCFAGGGVWHPQSSTLKRVRDFFIDNPQAWKKATRSKAFRDNFEFWGESLTRPPRGYPVDHELIDDLKRKSFAAGGAINDTVVCSAELKPVLVEQFKHLAPMLDYLCAALELEF